MTFYVQLSILSDTFTFNFKIESVRLNAVTKAKMYLKDIEMVCEMIFRMHIEVKKYIVRGPLEHPLGSP